MESIRQHNQSGRAEAARLSGLFAGVGARASAGHASAVGIAGAPNHGAASRSFGMDRGGRDAIGLLNFLTRGDGSGAEPGSGPDVGGDGKGHGEEGQDLQELLNDVERELVGDLGNDFDHLDEFDARWREIAAAREAEESAPLPGKKAHLLRRMARLWDELEFNAKPSRLDRRAPDPANGHGFGSDFSSNVGSDFGSSFGSNVGSNVGPNVASCFSPRSSSAFNFSTTAASTSASASASALDRIFALGRKKPETPFTEEDWRRLGDSVLRPGVGWERDTEQREEAFSASPSLAAALASPPSSNGSRCRICGVPLAAGEVCAECARRAKRGAASAPCPRRDQPGCPCGSRSPREESPLSDSRLFNLHRSGRNSCRCSLDGADRGHDQDYCCSCGRGSSGSGGRGCGCGCARGGMGDGGGRCHCGCPCRYGVRCGCGGGHIDVKECPCRYCRGACHAAFGEVDGGCLADYLARSFAQAKRPRRRDSKGRWLPHSQAPSVPNQADLDSAHGAGSPNVSESCSGAVREAESVDGAESSGSREALDPFDDGRCPRSRDWRPWFFLLAMIVIVLGIVVGGALPSH